MSISLLFLCSTYLTASPCVLNADFQSVKCGMDGQDTFSLKGIIPAWIGSVIHLKDFKKSERRSCVNVEVAILGSPSLTVLTVYVDIKWHEKKISRANVQFVCGVYSWLQINLASDVFISPSVLVSCNTSVLFYIHCYFLLEMLSVDGLSVDAGMLKICQFLWNCLENLLELFGTG